MIDNEKLNSALEKGETIKWTGVAQPYGLFDESRKSSTITSIVCALAWAVLSMGGYYALTRSNGADIKTGVMIVLLAISFIILWMPISDKSKIKKLTYAITDKRAIIVSKENNNPIAMNFADIDAIRTDKGDNGNSSVRVGSAVFKAAPRKLPGLAYHGEFVSQNDNKTYTGLVFFNVSAEDGRTISNLLEPAISAAKA